MGQNWRRSPCFRHPRRQIVSISAFKSRPTWNRSLSLFLYVVKSNKNPNTSFVLTLCPPSDDGAPAADGPDSDEQQEEEKLDQLRQEPHLRRVVKQSLPGTTIYSVLHGKAGGRHDLNWAYLPPSASKRGGSESVIRPSVGPSASFSKPSPAARPRDAGFFPVGDGGRRYAARYAGWLTPQGGMGWALGRRIWLSVYTFYISFFFTHFSMVV